MRKITEQATEAFNNAEKFKKDNMLVTVDRINGGKGRVNSIRMYLYNNLIAHNLDGDLHITNCGYFTNTTKERLNSLNGVSIQQKKGVWYLNGQEWNGELIEIN